MYFLCSLERWDFGFESHSRNVLAFVLCFCVCSGLTSAVHSIKVSYRLSEIKELKWNEAFKDALSSKVATTGMNKDRRQVHQIYLHTLYRRRHCRHCKVRHKKGHYYFSSWIIIVRISDPSRLKASTLNTRHCLVCLCCQSEAFSRASHSSVTPATSVRE
jgi:hypothetical protein